MAKYIRRDTLIKRFFEKVDMSKRIVDGKTAERFSTFEKLMDVVMDMPTADVVPVKHGRWVDKRKEDCFDGEEPFEVGMENGEPLKSCYCSECGEWLVASDEYGVKGRYCPNCGAKMESEG